MIQALQKLTTFDEFIAWKPEDGRFELRNGLIVEMQPTGKHEEVTGCLVTEFIVEVRRLQLPFFPPQQALIKSPTEANSAYLPDVLFVDRTQLASEPLWERASTLSRGASIAIVVEVVSTNWRDDYLKKFADYEELGIQEYWIADHRGLGGKRHIGTPKQPTLSVCELIDGEYVIRKFRGSERIISPTFPDLQLTAEQIFRAGQPAQ